MKIVNGFKLLSIFEKSSIDVLLGSKYNFEGYFLKKQRSLCMDLGKFIVATNATEAN